MGNDAFGINTDVVRSFAIEINDVVKSGVQICIVVGGGNIYRGISGTKTGMDRATGDHMGMLATVMNSLAIQNALEQIGVETRVQSALPISAVCEPYIRRRAKRHMQKGRVVIFAAGTGNPNDALPACSGKRDGSPVKTQRSTFLLTVTAFVIAFLYVPMVLLVIYSFNHSRIVAIWGGWSTRWYKELFTSPEVWEAVSLSLKIATVNA